MFPERNCAGDRMGAAAQELAGTFCGQRRMIRRNSWSAMKIDFFTDRIFAVTPRGDVIDLPVGSTPIDFAYHVHSEVGNAATAARERRHEHARPRFANPATSSRSSRKKERSRPRTGFALQRRRSPAITSAWPCARKKCSPARSVCPRTPNSRLTVEDRVGLIKDISGSIAESHIGIMSFHTEPSPGKRFHLNKVDINSTDKKKIDKLIEKLRKVKGVKDLGYRLI
jgi:hypothetical protein